ncbi:uncharacterized protein LOC132197510 [Neocloeon triangulifer]|uniref:uncharacterized protein LOC132197510 n=1 Tax=Neocloeon triangulifer TaxID=2078957 RepID=UPI00286F70BF|nr:uncharacterized protein LOC132197510 [Neocloeon triangulifer]
MAVVWALLPLLLQLVPIVWCQDIDFDSDDEPLNRRTRAVLNVLPYTSIVGVLQSAQACCDAPILIPNYVQSACGATSRVVTYRTSNRGIFGGLLGTLVRPFLNRAAVSGRASAEDVLLNVCYADCAYQGLGLVDPSTISSSSSLNMDSVYQLFTNATDYYPDWSDIIANATDYCSSTAFTSPRAIRTSTGRICSTYPLKFSICIRRYLLEECLSDNLTQSTSCDNSLNNLRSLAAGFSLRSIFGPSSPYRLIV